MATVVVRDRQNVFDIAIQEFGDVSFASQIIEDNDLTWASPLAVGQVLIINNEELGLEEVKDFYKLTGRVVVSESAQGGANLVGDLWQDGNLMLFQDGTAIDL